MTVPRTCAERWERDPVTSPHHSYDIADPGLAPLGRQRVAWAETQMPVLAGIRTRFAKETPLRGLRVAHHAAP